MPKGYHHLAYEERCLIFILTQRGESKHQIAKELKVCRSTIYRELARNEGKKGYRYKQAHKKSCKRHQKVNRRKLKMTGELLKIVESKLTLQCSPEQIAGWIDKNHSHYSISHEAIYKYIWKDKGIGGGLFKHLRHCGKKYNKRVSGKAGRGCIPNRVDIDHRPPIVEEKSRLGDWEVDTVIGGGHNGAIVSMVERASKVTKIVKVNHKTAEEVSNALIMKLSPIKDYVLTLTADNGKEFAHHQQISLFLEADFSLQILTIRGKGV